jgi:hypothetical protein
VLRKALGKAIKLACSKVLNKELKPDVRPRCALKPILLQRMPHLHQRPPAMRSYGTSGVEERGEASADGLEALEVESSSSSSEVELALLLLLLPLLATELAAALGFGGFGGFFFFFSGCLCGARLPHWPFFFFCSGAFPFGGMICVWQAHDL